MADDCRISCALPQHPKLIKLQRRLGDGSGWNLVCLLLWAAANRPDGDLRGLTIEDIEIAAGWSGTSGDFVNTLSELRFLDGDVGSYKVHDWVEHNPWAANRGRRIQAAKIAASARWDRKVQATENGAENANCMRTACTLHKTAMPTTQTPPNPNTAQPDPTQHHRTAKSKPCSGADAPPLPAWIPTDAWSGFIEMRKKSRKPLTNRAVILIVNELEKLRTQGQDIGAVLDQSTRNNWQDVYPVKETRSNGNGNGKGSTREVYERERAIIDARTQ